jgi:hypothetical protein
MIVECKCDLCNKDFRVDLIAQCSLCLIKNFIQNKPSKWKLIKEFSWYALFTMPVIAMISIVLGWEYQLIFLLGGITFPVALKLADWLNKRF